MKFILYLLWLLALPFILLVVIYEKILQLVYWFMDIDEQDEPPTQRQRPDNYTEKRPPTTEEQRIIEPPERKQQDDDGMNPQERTLPYIQPEPKPEEREEPKKEPLPEIVFETRIAPKDDRKRTRRQGGLSL